MGKALKTLSRTLRIPFNRRFAFKRLQEYHARQEARNNQQAEAQAS